MTGVRSQESGARLMTGVRSQESGVRISDASFLTPDMGES